jgi:flagellin
MVAINTNIASLVGQNNMRQVNNELEKAMERLSSGLRINSAGDDAAGLAISSRMESQIRGLQAAIKNANDGISVTQVAEGAMEEVENILQRMRELAVQSANDSNSDADRAYLQAEVSQLSEEITRISETTQFNGQNVLDGSYTDKYFQIGANANQNVGLSIANLSSSALGIGTTTSTSSSSTTTTSTAATEEIARINFGFDDTYSFQLTDRDTGLSYQIAGDAVSVATGDIDATNETLSITDHGLKTGDEIALSGNGSMTGTFYAIKIDEDTVQVATSEGNAINGTAADITAGAAVALTPSGLTLNLDDDQSKSDFVERVNAGLAESSVNTTVTGNAASDSASYIGSNSAGATTNLTTIDGDHFKFSLTVDGETNDIDFLNRALTAAATDTGATMTEIVTGMRNQVQAAFDDSITITQSGGVFTVEDAQGRAISLEKGAGTGYFFGTDTQNSGAIETAATTQNNLTVAFDGDDLIINHAAAGGVDLTNYTAAASTTYTQFTPSAGATSALTEPVILTDAAVSTSISTTGVVGESKIAINFSNVFGYGDDGINGTDAELSATYAFELTDGAGNIYASFTGGDILDIQRLNNSDAVIVSAVEAQIMASAFADTSITDDEFEVDYNGGVLTISNKMGRDLAIENFSSDYGSAMVSKLDGLGGYEELSSKGALPSEIRVTRGFGSTLSATTAYFMLNVDGGSTAFTVDMTAAFDGGNLTGWSQATAIEAAFQATTGIDANVRVSYDSETDQFAINDILGRQFQLSGWVAQSGGSAIFQAGTFVQEENIVNAANKNNSVNVATDVVSGVLTEAAVVDLTFSQDTLTSTFFSVNGSALSASTFNFDTDTFSGSDFETNLDALMSALNGEYNGTAISYSMDEDNRTLTLTHAKGGELIIDTMVSSNASLTMAATVQSGIGTDTTIAYYEAITSASIEGDGTVDGEATVTTSSSASSGTTTTSGINQISISTQDGANSALASIDNAITQILSERSMLGALENRLDHTISNLSNVSTNTSAAKSRILDTDFATETANLTKNQILSQAATSMLAQANQSKQSILALLQ